jgi:hypothetical protein
MHGEISIDEIYRDYGDTYPVPAHGPSATHGYGGHYYLVADDFSYLRIDWWKPNDNDN